MLTLIEKPDIYKLIIPEEVQRKIKMWCSVSPSTEWSGTLFYRYTGTFEGKDLVITIADFLVSDIGTSTYTEYDVKPEIISYMLDNNLLDCKCGLIHSHQNFSTFFSGTDTSTLQSEGVDTPHFVSLIVNNNGPYCAKITRRVTEKIAGTVEIEYPTFDDGKVTSSEDCRQTTSTHLEAFKLDIEIEGDIDNSLRNEVEARYKELTAVKKRQTPSSYYGSSHGEYGGSYKGATSVPSFQSKAEEDKEEKKEKTLVCNGDYKDLDDTPHIPDNMLKALVGQILYGSITMSAESYDKLNKKEWLSTNMKKCFERKFGKGDAGIKKYDYWASAYIDAILQAVEEPALLALGYDEEDIICIAASDIRNTLISLDAERKNKYVDILIDNLEDYIYDFPTFSSKNYSQPTLFNQNLKDNDCD